jgi:hypothetical protein
MPPVLRDPRADRLAALLADLGPSLRRGSALQPSSFPAADTGSNPRLALPAAGSTPAPSSARICSDPARPDQTCRPSGWSAVDVLIGGGFPIDRLSEITGPASSGRTSIALGLLARTTRGRGELAAVIDLADAFDPASAEAAGVDLERVLWARVGDWREALRSTERLLETEGIPVVILDLGGRISASSASLRSAGLPASSASLRSAGLSASSASLRSSARRAVATETAIPDSAWIRLARLAVSTRTALVTLSDRRLTGSQAEVVLEMRAPRPRFSGSPPLLEEIGLRAVLARRRGEPLAGEASTEGDLSGGDAMAERLIRSG